MSKTVDSRVVEMKFDNQQFEKNVSTSMTTLDKLKQSLNLTGASKGLENIDAAAKKFDMSGISNAVESVRVKFSALEVMAVTALMNIANSAVNAGKQMLNALVVAPVTDGFKEYELVLNATQTTMAGTGKTAKEVESQLIRLDKYADDTIYSTSDMLSNLPKFTNAGVDLEKSVTAMIGIANATAIAGGSAAQASSAFYNLGQSIGTGYLTRMDYNSINLAGTATVEWKKQMISAAIAQGTLTQAGENAYKIGNKNFTLQSLFIDGLQEQWASTEVMLKVFGDYGDVTTDIGKRAQASAQDLKSYTMMMESLKASAGTGWKETWQLIFGDLAEAKVFWTGLGDAINVVIGQMAEARNQMLRVWKNSGGRDALIESFKNLFAGIDTILKPIKEAFNDIFPPINGIRLSELTKSLQAFTAGLKIGDETAGQIKRTFAGLFSILDLVGQGFGFLFNVAKEVFGLFAGPAAGGILGLTASFGDFFVTLRDGVKEGDFFAKKLEKIKMVLANVSGAITSAIDRIKTAFNSFKGSDTEAVGEFAQDAEEKLSPLAKIGAIIASVFEAIVKVFEWAAPIVANLGSIISGAFSALASTVGGAVENMEFSEIFDLINAGLFAGLLLGMKKFMSSLTGITDSAGGFLDKVKGILDGVRESLDAYQKQLKSKTILNIAIAIGILAASLLVLSLIPGDKLTSALAALTVVFVELTVAMGYMQKLMGAPKMVKTTTQMIGISVAILILSAAMATLASLDWDGVAKGTIGIGALMFMLVVMSDYLSKNKIKLIEGSKGLILFAAGIYVLALAVEKLGSLDIPTLVNGLLGVTALLVVMSAFTQSVKPEKMLGLSASMVVLGIALLVLTQSVKQLGSLNVPTLVNGLIGVTALLLVISAFTQNVKSEKMISASIAIAIMGAALLVLTQSVKQLGALNIPTLVNGLLGVSALLIVISAFTNSVQPEKMLSVGASMVVMGAGLLVIAQVIKTLGAIPIGQIIIGLVTLAAAFAIIGAAAAILYPSISAIYALSTSILILGAGIMLIGMGIGGLAQGLIILAGSSAIVATAIVAIGSAVASLIPVFFQKLAEGIQIALGILINSGPLIKEAFIVVLQAALDAIVESIPMIIDAIYSLMIGILDVLNEKMPELVDKLFTLVTGFMDKLTEKIPELIKKGAALLGALLKGIFDSLGGYKPENLFKLLACFTLLVGMFVVLAAAKRVAKDAILGAGAMALVIGIIAALFMVISNLKLESVLEIALSISAVLLAISASIVALSFIPIPAAISAIAGLAIFVGGLTVLLAALGGLAQIPGLEWLLKEGASMLVTIGDAIGAFVGSIASGFLTEVSSAFPQIGSDLSAFMENAKPFIEGAKTMDAEAMAGVKALAETVLILTAANILEGLTSWLTGGTSMIQFGEQLAAFAPHFLEYYNIIKDVKGDVIQSSANAAKTLADFAAAIPTTGGLLGKITGENSITQFAEELVLFAPALVSYGEIVKDFKEADVVESIAAAKALADMAAALPEQGGAVAWFTGDNTLSMFALELSAFGPEIMTYAKSVTGLNPAAVLISAVAVKAVADMSNSLPNQGGAVTWFTGDNKLSTIAKELALFGPSLMEYAKSVTGLNPMVVVTSIIAAKALAELANSLPTDGGLFSDFTGNKDIAMFGLKLVSFGRSFAMYANTVTTADLSKVPQVTKELQGILALANEITDQTAGGLGSFGQSLQTLAKTSIDGFIAAFYNATARVKAAAAYMLTSLTSAIEAKKTDVNAAFIRLVESAITTLDTEKTKFTTSGTAIVTEIINGINSAANTVTGPITSIMYSCLSVIENYYGYFYSSGKRMVEGFANGIDDTTYLAEAQAKKMARAAADAAAFELQEESPSKVGYRIGSFFGHGFVNAIVDYAKESYKAGATMAASAKTGLNNAISKIVDVFENDIDTQPTIRPVLDLSNVESGTRRLNAMFSRSQAGSISVGMSGVYDDEIQNGEKTGSAGSNISFTQNNYSPKALSRLEIYRQTKNQFSVMKGLVEI